MGIGQDIKNLLKLENSCSGKKGFIIATGPSLAYRDMSFLKDHISIGINLSPLMFDQWGFQPDFHLVSDRYLYSNPDFRKVFLDLIVNKPFTKIVVAHGCKDYPLEFADENTFLVPKVHPQRVINFSENPIRDGFWRGKTVSYDAIQFSFFLGFDEVYVLGMDMTVNHIWGKNGHSYEIQSNSRFSNINHPKSDSFHIQRGLPGKPEYRELITQYMLKAREHFEKAGRKLYFDSRSTIQGLEKMDVLSTFSHIPKIVAFVPAKGTSERVENKNTKFLGDKPLFLHVLDTLLDCYTIDEVYLDTDSEKVIKMAGNRRHKVIKRPGKLATNKTDGNQLLLYEASQVTDADIYVQVLPTAPFITTSTIDCVVYELIKSQIPDSVFGVRRQKKYIWDENGKSLNYDPEKIPNSVDLDIIIEETMGVYAIRKNALIKRKCRIGYSPILYEIPLIESIDVNTLEDFKFAEVLNRGIIKGD